MNWRRSAAVAVVAVVGAVLLALWVSGVRTADGYPLYIASAAFTVVVAAALVVMVVLFLLARRWL